MNTTEKNKLIAEFMGNNAIGAMNDIYGNQDHNFPVQHTCTVDDLLYHSSWDWLMPVIKEMNATYDVLGNLDEPAIESLVHEIEDCIWKNDITTAHRLVVEYLSCQN